MSTRPTCTHLHQMHTDVSANARGHVHLRSQQARECGGGDVGRGMYTFTVLCLARLYDTKNVEKIAGHAWRMKRVSFTRVASQRDNRSALAGAQCTVWSYAARRRVRTGRRWSPGHFRCISFLGSAVGRRRRRGGRSTRGTSPVRNTNIQPLASMTCCACVRARVKRQERGG